MKKNYDKIATIDDKDLSIAIAQCTDPELLKRLELAFPECFFEGDDRIPLSHIRYALEVEDDDPGIPKEAFFERKFNVSCLHLAHPSWVDGLKKKYEEVAEPMTSEIIEKWESWQPKEDMGHRGLDPIIHFEFRGDKYFLLYVYSQGAEEESEECKPWEIFAIPCNMIDEDH